MLTAADMFCGAGGSSMGAEMAGVELKLALNHWQRAIETHQANFPHAEHDCEDVSSLTTGQIRRYPDTDILLASPECTNHSLAKGAQRRKPQAGSLFDDGPAGSDEQDRSRATMWDVVRFAEQKQLKGQPYKSIIVENVPDAFKWGYNDDGGLFDAWRQAMRALGYEHEIVWLNSMFAPPTPQSRDRMYVVFWLRGIRKPNLKVTPPAWCPHCDRLVAAVQAWKRPGASVWGKFGAQYFYACPDCHKMAIPGAFPAASAIDWHLPAQVIGERDRPLAEKTMERIKRGLDRLSSEPFALRLLQSGTAKPLTLPLMTCTQRHDIGMVLPIAGNTFERTPGNRARDAQLHPVDTIHGTLERALVFPYSENGMPRVAHLEPAQTQRTNPTLAAVIPMERNTVAMRVEEMPVHTVKAGGQHHGFVTANYDPGWTRRAGDEPFGTVTTTDSHSLVLPYDRTGVGAAAGREPTPTATTRDRLALVVPRKDSEIGPVAPREWSREEVEACRFRMFDLGEIARVMAMESHPTNGGPYEVTGNKRERMAQYGNAVTPPVMRLLVGRVAAAIDEKGAA